VTRIEDQGSEAIKDQKRVKQLFLVVTLLLVFIMAARSPLDSDLWWHLRAGEQMLKTGKPLLSDVFSYTRFGSAWINHSWLSEIILAGLFRAGGFLALGGLVSVLAAGSMALIFLQMEGPAVVLSFIVILASLVAAPLWTPRPQLFSFALFAVMQYLLYLYKWKEKNLLWVLPPLFLVWSNLHGGYTLGFLLIGTIILGEILNHLTGNASALPWAKILRLSLWSLAGFLAAGINPNGINIWLIPFKTINVSVLQQFIQEWASPDFHDLTQQPFLWLLFALFISTGLSGRKSDGSDLVSVSFFGILALAARRNFGPFALAAAPVLARSLQALTSSWQERLRLPAWFQRQKANQKDLPFAVTRGINLSLVAVLGLTACLKLYGVTHPAVIDAQVRSLYPAGAVTWLRDHPASGRIFNAYNWGGYLTWSLPEYPVFVDGRTDLFGDEILGEWMKIVQADAGWQALLDQWNVRLILVEPDRPVVKLLSENGWKLVLQEKDYVLYQR
jgi:hypothetical protein